MATETREIRSETLFELTARCSNMGSVRHWWDGSGFTTNPGMAWTFFSKAEALADLPKAQRSFSRERMEELGHDWYMHSFKVQGALLMEEIV